MPKIVLRFDKTIPFTQLDALTESVGWGTRGEDAWDQIKNFSSVFVTAWNDEKIIGMARTVSDGTMCMVYDVAVSPLFQGQGVGTRLMQQIMNALNEKSYQSIGLFAWDKNPANLPFYGKFGFKQVGFGMKYTPAPQN